MKKVNTRMYATDNTTAVAYIIFILLFIFVALWANYDLQEDFLTIEREYRSVNIDRLGISDTRPVGISRTLVRHGSDNISGSMRADTLATEDNGLDSGDEVQEVEGFHTLEGVDAEEIEDEIIEGQIEMTAQLVEAEAGNQDFKGKCLVADVVYNRVKSGTFPDDIESVIFQYLTDKYGDKHYQFSTVIDGSYENAGWYISEDSFKAAYQEYYAERRIDDRILYFTAGSYNPFCIPAYKYGDHYFGY